MLFHFLHTFKPVAVNHYIDSSFGGEAKSTTVTFMCTTCSKMKTQNLYNSGHLTLEQITSAIDKDTKNV
jgi:hypothetical protein